MSTRGQAVWGRAGVSTKGYRYLKLKAEDEDDFEVDIDLNGPFVTLRAGF